MTQSDSAACPLLVLVYPPIFAVGRQSMRPADYAKALGIAALVLMVDVLIVYVGT